MRLVTALKWDGAEHSTEIGRRISMCFDNSSCRSIAYNKFYLRSWPFCLFTFLLICRFYHEPGTVAVTNDIKVSVATAFVVAASSIDPPLFSHAYRITYVMISISSVRVCFDETNSVVCNVLWFRLVRFDELINSIWTWGRGQFCAGIFIRPELYEAEATRPRPSVWGRARVD